MTPTNKSLLITPTVTASEAPEVVQRRTNFLVAGVMLWALPMLIITGMVIHNPSGHTVTLGSYHPAAAAWWHRQSLYVGPAGMNYLPHFAILYSPFHILPFCLSEVLWRWCAALTLAIGLWKLMREVMRWEPERAFFWATALAMPLCLGALRNGNANAIFGGVTLLAIAATAQERWWQAIIWMALAIALKPLGVVLLMLVAVYYRPLALRAAPAMVSLAIFPFLFGAPAYVCSQYADAWHNLGKCAAVTEHRFADLNGIFRTFGKALPPTASTLVRGGTGVFTAGLWFWGAKRLERPWRELWLYALVTSYLMVFNPMTEANSYVILAPALGAWSVCLSFTPPFRGQGWIVAAMVLSMALLPNLLRPWFGNSFALFWHPFMTLVFVGVLVSCVGRKGAWQLPQPLP